MLNMESGRGQRRPTATARVVRFSIAPEKARDHSEKGDSSMSSGFMPRQTVFPVLPQTSADRLREAREKLLEMEMEQQSKEAELVHFKALLDKKAAHEKDLTLEIYELKDRLEEEEHHRKEAELRSAERYIEAKNYCAAMEELRKKLDMCYSTKDTLMEEMRALGECSILFPNLLDDTKMNLKKTLLKKKALKRKIQHLIVELEGCRKELDTKSKQYQDTVGSMVALQEKLQELQQRVQDLSAENAKCQDKTNFLEHEHASVLSHRDSLDQQLKEEQEEKALLEACLRKLAGSLCSHLDLENTSTLAVIEALGSALQRLLLENSSLHDKEALNDSTVKELTTEKAVLLAEKEALANKVKDFDELQEIKLRLEDELLVERHTNKEMTQNFRDFQLKAVDVLDQMEREHAEAVSSLDEGAQEIVSANAGLRTELSKHLFNWRHQANRMSELNDECVQKDMELQRLNMEAANYASAVRDLKDENRRLYEGVTNFEQLALQSADDLDQAQREIASLKEALAMAQTEAVSVEEREKAAQLLLEKESQISFMEEKLKEMEGAMAKLNQEMMEACKIADLLRDANEGLRNALLSRDKELEENRVDTNVQTDDTIKVDCVLQTDDTTEANMSLLPKVDCDVQTTDTGDDEIISKFASTQLELNRLNVSFQRLSFEKAALEDSHKGCESMITAAQCARLELEMKVEDLKKQVITKSDEVNKQRRMINSLQASLQQSQQKIQRASHVNDQATAALKTQNEHLKSEMSKLMKKVQDLTCELNTVKETEAMKLKRVEQLYKQSQEQIQFLKKASCGASPGASRIQVKTPMAQESSMASAAEQAAGHGRPLIREAMFTPESTQTPTKPSFPLAAALATPPSVVELSSDDSSEVSLSKLVEQIDPKTPKDAQPKESDAGALIEKERSSGEHTGAAKAPVEMPLTKTPRGKRASASVTPRQRKSEKSRGSKASTVASPRKAPTAAAVQKRSAKPSSKPDDPLLWPEAQMSDQSSLAAPKRRKFFKTKDSDVDELFKTSFI